MNFKPMLSADASAIDPSELKYPLLSSYKLDGIRCVIWEGVAYSRNGKPIRNGFVQSWAKDFHNLDGELIVGSPTDSHCLNITQSGVMSFDGEPDFQFYAFDIPQQSTQFVDRLGIMIDQFGDKPRIVCVPHVKIESAEALLQQENEYLEQGYEGIMLRHPYGPYKNGRSTMREGYLMKIKRFQDGEAVVVAVEEGCINDNELERDELGRAKRSKMSELLRPSGMVGTLLAVDPVWGPLRIAPGKMPHNDRRAFWLDQSRILGKTIHWRSFGYGVKDKPRFPRYYGIREDV